MPVPSIGPEDVPQIPTIFADLTFADKQGIIASYYTAAAYLDLNVGRVLSAIEELGLNDETLVIYLGDNGYHLGQHGRFEKHCLYERAVRVPMVMRLPGRVPAGTSTAALVEFVDVVPTVLDYLGLPVAGDQSAPRDLHGVSLRPLIDGKTKQVREVAFSEYQHTEIAMARTQTHKLVYRTSKAADDWMLYEPLIPPRGRGVFLYDLRSDPEELHNVADDPANAKLVSHLLDRLAEVYRRTPPVGEPPPEQLSREDFLDWAIAPRKP
jgi:arylsulfatase A-like enzyme